LAEDLPPGLSETSGAVLLRGEALFRGGETEGSRRLYEEFLEREGFEEAVAVALAAVYESQNQPEEARALYGKVMQRCTSCRSRPNPDVMHRYAELCFTGGQRDGRLLDMYLALVRDRPGEAALYYQRVSRIYADKGHRAEAERFHAFAERERAHREGQGETG
jgi:hypothetical protein